MSYATKRTLAIRSRKSPMPCWRRSRPSERPARTAVAATRTSPERRPTPTPTP